MSEFRALRVHKKDSGVEARLESLSPADLEDDDVLIEAHYSSVNYKDALAALGAGKIMRSFPLIGGVDVAGVVAESRDARFEPGDEVLITGFGLSEHHNGGFSEYVRAPGDWLVKRPAGLDLYETMALGSAGFTAGLAVVRMQQMDQRPDHGPVVVTGATGGVAGVAIDILAQLGYEVAAFTGKPEMSEYLKGLGAREIVDAHNTDLGRRPLEAGTWGGAIDAVGGDVLAWLTRTVKPWGNIASIGLTGGAELHTTVMPFILRGVNLLGIDSVYCPMTLREKVWHRLGGDMKPRHLDAIISGSVSLDELMPLFRKFLDRKVWGRYVVDLRA